MHYSPFTSDQTQDIVQLITAAFSAAAGADEGDTVGELVTELVATTKGEELLGCVAKNTHHKVIGCVFFSRLQVPNDQYAFLLSPLAVISQYQGQGIGQALVQHGLEQLKTQGVDLVFTYGDPAFYGKIGFRTISTDTVPAPFPLSQPIGWLVQSLHGRSIEAIDGKTVCVTAFNHPEYW